MRRTVSKDYSRKLTAGVDETFERDGTISVVPSEQLAPTPRNGVPEEEQPFEESSQHYCSAMDEQSSYEQAAEELKKSESGLDS